MKAAAVVHHFNAPPRYDDLTTPIASDQNDMPSAT